MVSTLSEYRTARYCIHPYFGFVCNPNSVIDFAEGISPPLGRSAIAHIDRWGFRNRDLPDRKPDDETWIGLFGGSVAFSVASSSNETTIAGHLETILNGATGGRRRIRVINLALAAGQQPQSLLIFATRAAELDGAIVFDGVNEALVPAYYNRGAIPPSFPYRPIYDALFARAITDEQAAIQWWIQREEAALAASGGALSSFWESRGRRRRIADLRGRLRAAAPSEFSVESVYPRLQGGMEQFVDEGIDNWRDCTRTMHALARATETEIVSILQPMPERGKPLTERERRNVEAQPEVVAIRRRAHERLSRHAAELVSEGVACIDFADVFSGRAEELYADIGHFNDEACRIVAERMAAAAVGGWDCVKGIRP